MEGTKGAKKITVKKSEGPGVKDLNTIWQDGLVDTQLRLGIDVRPEGPKLVVPRQILGLVD